MHKYSFNTDYRVLLNIFDTLGKRKNYSWSLQATPANSKAVTKIYWKLLTALEFIKK